VVAGLGRADGGRAPTRASEVATVTTQTLAQVLQQARDEAKTILSALEQAGHPQTEESSAVYLGLVTLQKRIAAMGASGASVLAPEIEQLAALCARKLERLKPLLEQAARLARGGAAPP
jgi:hypothetical protein